MSNYLVHSGMFDRNQFRVLLDRFDFIHRCYFHSRWYSREPRSRRLWFWSWLYARIARRILVLGIQLSGNQSVIPSLDLHFIPFHTTSFNDHWIFNAYSVCLFVPNPLPPFLGHWFRIQSSIDSVPSFHHNPDWFS